MKSKSTNILMRSKNILLIALAVAFLLLIPWLAMQFTDEVAWSPSDFIVAGTLLFGTGLAYELVARKMRLLVYQAGVGVALGAALLLVWVNLAVGIIGSEDNPLNWMYAGVLAVLITGALMAQFKPNGMARALFATALAQTLVTVIALVADKNLPVFQMVILNGFFAALWIGSAVLFQRANATLTRRLE